MSDDSNVQPTLRTNGLEQHFSNLLFIWMFDFVEMQTLIQEVCGGAWNFTFLASFQVMLVLPIHGPSVTYGIEMLKNLFKRLKQNKNGKYLHNSSW